MKVLILLSEAYYRYEHGFKAAFMANGCENVDFFKLGIFSHELTGLKKFAYKTGLKDYKNQYCDKVLKGLNKKINILKPDFILVIADFSDIDNYLQDKLIAYFEKNNTFVWLLDSIKTMQINKKLLYNVNKLYVFEYHDLEYIKNNYAGVKRVAFLPFGCDNLIFCNSKELNNDEKRPIDICFVGVADNKRIKILNELAKYCRVGKKKLVIYGHFWHNKHWYQRIIGAVKFKNKYPALFSYINNNYITPVEANELYGKSKICINIHQDVHLGPNPRTFEILGNGNFQLCDNQDFTGIDLIDKQDLVIYDSNDMEALIKKVKYYLAAQDKRYLIGESGMYKTRKFYTFENNIKKFLNDYNNFVSDKNATN